MFGLHVGAEQSSATSAPGISLPSVETSQSVTLRGADGNAGFGFDICGDAAGAITVQSLQTGGPAQQSGVIQPGDRISGININMGGMSVDDARKLLDSLANYPLSFNIRKAASTPNVSLPGFGVAGGLEGPELNVSTDGSAELGLQQPCVKGKLDADIPDVGISGGVSGPKVDLPGGRIGHSVDSQDIKLPAVSGSINGTPGISGSVHGPGAGVGMSGNIGGSPRVDVPVSGSVAVPDVRLSGGGISGDVKAPGVDIPQFEVNGSQLPGVGVAGTVKGPQLEVEGGSGIGGPKMQAGLQTNDVDLTLPAGPSGTLETNGPDADVHVKGPSIGGKFKGFFQGSGKKKKVPTATLR